MGTMLIKVIRGLASVSEIYEPRKITLPERSGRAAMRNDWAVIRNDFRVVIERENKKTKRVG